MLRCVPQALQSGVVAVADGQHIDAPAILAKIGLQNQPLIEGIMLAITAKALKHSGGEEYRNCCRDLLDILAFMIVSALSC